MKAKVIKSGFEEYGQVIDVVLNHYMGKYTDGKRIFPKEALSFDIESEDDDEDKITELAFKLLCAKESASVKLSADEDIDAKIEYVFNLARRFREYKHKDAAPDTEEVTKGNEPAVSVSEPIFVNGDTPKKEAYITIERSSTLSKEEIERMKKETEEFAKEELSLSDFKSQLDDLEI